MRATNSKQQYSTSTSGCVSVPVHLNIASALRLARTALPYLCVLPGLLLATDANAEFVMNFAGPTSTSIMHGDRGINGQTPFTAMGPNEATGDYVIDPSNGLGYWHYVLGDPSSGFAQEVYIRATSSSCGQFSTCSASYGLNSFGGNNVMGSNKDTVSGNGTGNPNAVIMRQVLGGSWDASTHTWTCDTGYCDEFLKSSYANKPKITQGIATTDFTAKFIADMSNVAISDSSTTLTVTNGSTGATGSSLTNTQTIIDPQSSDPITFDMANDVQSGQSSVSAGRYTYVTGGGVLGANGTYVYVDGGYNPSNVDYTPFLDPTVANPRAYPDTTPLGEK